MKQLIRSLLTLTALGAALMTPSVTHAQRSSRGQPKTPFGATDFAKLKWLEGSWVGTAPEETPIYSRYHFATDSLIEITYVRDSTFSQESGTGRVYLTVGRVFHAFGPSRWGASNVDSTGVYFIPQVNAHNTYSWTYQSPDSWTATQRNGLSGRERVTVYQMKRVKP